jgi:hypothetical protein
MTPFLRKLFGLNWLLLANMIALAAFGVVAIYSATCEEDPIATEFWRTGELGGVGSRFHDHELD